MMNRKKFSDYLHTCRKKSRDKLLPSTIDRYMYWYDRHASSLSSQMSVADANALIQSSQSIIMYTMMKHYLICIGVEKKPLLDLYKPISNPSALHSIQVLQSKLLSHSELKQLVTTDYVFAAMVSVSYDGALRRSELMNIKLPDIVLLDKNKNKRDYDAGVRANITVLGKGNKHRTINIRRTSLELIKKIHGDSFHTKKGLLFEYKSTDGRVYDKQTDMWYKRCHKISLALLGRHVHPHMFRHTKLTHMADAGSDVLGISKYAGHSNLSTTEIYIHCSSFVGLRSEKAFGRDIQD